MIPLMKLEKYKFRKCILLFSSETVFISSSVQNNGQYVK
jgi:hypothetical protein